MDKERFNTLLADMDKITDTDIKSLNQLRKQYPYFQNQYVLIAKALKSRSHPKTDAFIKKAAIYSADRALLKSIIMEEHAFAPVAEEPVVEQPEAVSNPSEKVDDKVESVVIPTATEPEITVSAVTAAEISIETVAAPKNEDSEPKAPEAIPESVAELKTTTVTQPEKEIPPVLEKTVTENTTSETEVKAPRVESNQALIDELARDLLEIRKKKQLIAKMLEQQEAKQVEKKPKEVKKKASSSKNSQSELIEKFIQNEPQMGRQKLVPDENQPGQTDLAAQFIRESEDFHTETMANIMVFQKKYRKAIQIYEKLGLKFPEKRAYFASQIEKVKEKSNG